MASTNQGPRRIGQWLYLRPECIDEYKKCHASVWPEVLEQIKDSNVRDCMSAISPSFYSIVRKLYVLVVSSTLLRISRYTNPFVYITYTKRLLLPTPKSEPS